MTGAKRFAAVARVDVWCARVVVGGGWGARVDAWPTRGRGRGGVRCGGWRLWRGSIFGAAGAAATCGAAVGCCGVRTADARRERGERLMHGASAA